MNDHTHDLDKVKGNHFSVWLQEMKVPPLGLLWDGEFVPNVKVLGQWHTIGRN